MGVWGIKEVGIIVAFDNAIDSRDLIIFLYNFATRNRVVTRSNEHTQIDHPAREIKAIDQSVNTA